MDSIGALIVLLILCILFQGYFTMMEMAFVTFNRVRLAYFVSKESQRAVWLHTLLSRPTYMFGTTLLGVNFFLQLGSECSRLLFYQAGINPDYAYIMQVILVLLFAELAPMFAGRAFSEHVTMIGIGPIYFLSKILKPIVWVLNSLCILIDKIFKVPHTNSHFLSREELQKAIESKDERRLGEEEQLSTLMENIFAMKTKSPSEMMVPIQEVTTAEYQCKAVEVKPLIRKEYTSYIPLYYENEKQIYGILYTRDLLRISDDTPIRDVARSPWFITEKNSIFQILKQFRWNNQGIAVILDDEGNAIGVLTLDRLIDEIFSNVLLERPLESGRVSVMVDRAYPADTSVADINRELAIALPHDEGHTLEDLMEEKLGHQVNKSDYVQIGDFELVLEDKPLMDKKSIRVKNR